MDGFRDLQVGGVLFSPCVNREAPNTSRMTMSNSERKHGVLEAHIRLTPESRSKSDSQQSWLKLDMHLPHLTALCCADIATRPRDPTPLD